MSTEDPRDKRLGEATLTELAEAVADWALFRVQEGDVTTDGLVDTFANAVRRIVAHKRGVTVQ